VIVRLILQIVMILHGLPLFFYCQPFFEPNIVLYYVLRNNEIWGDMHITTDIKPVTYLKAKAADLLDQINDTRRPVIITQNGEPRAVLQDPKSYEEMRNALGLLKLLAQGEEDIRKGNIRPQEEVFSDLERQLRESAS
jgi:prevent-host-death family protein